ncbi:alpha/beta hydrolase [Iamia sp. SCSIO 61187]|uniref:alpha/beta hydrolase n=1 Tax=Iamia sp. SCSIO 61187 TaxID=2722752 RepID=UPI001C625F48|nr:alpha/beta hydrolase [Iamia sp. SCSIO 61187]QYG92726.1 alpha/beta hydrolase [Iamia sp. SCSIO 61187]
MARSSRRSRPSAKRARARGAGREMLVASVVGAVNTANAREPLTRKGRGAVACFFPGWLTSEMPLHAIGWQALATAGFAARGALRSPSGLVGLGLSLGSWATLARLWSEAGDAPHVFERALRDGLGDGLDEATDPMAAVADPAVVRRRLLRGPLANHGKAWIRYRGLSYGEFGKRNHLDIWARDDLPRDGRAPVLLQVHGGAWVIGNKDQQATPLMAHMAERGWICVAINYRLSPRSTWPDHIVDVKRAIAWVKANIADHGGDPDFVAITGGSAGGHLSSLAALSANEPSWQPGFEEVDTSVVAAVPFYGVYDWTNRDGTGLEGMDDFIADNVMKTTLDDDRETWDKASTMSWVGPHAPPFMVVHGTNDTLVPVQQARSFVSMLKAESEQPVVYAELPGAQHAFEVFDSRRTLAAVGAVHRFLASIRAREDHDARSGEPDVPAATQDAVTPEG